MPDIVEIPASLRRITVGREGSAGEAWLGSLPGLIDELLQRWDCVPAGSPVSGKVGIIVPATSPVYGDVVLKVSFPHPANVHEPDAYATWNGRGAVAMCARDDASFAMLLERIDSVRPVEAVLVDGQITAAVVDAAIGIAGALARTLAVPAPAHLPRVAEQAAEWADK
ncbi:MAG: hypothetical protein J2P17_34550 [Mycobacterium sp.]|nr:hypothetical protein [Mycobacterium sp.]